MDKLKNLLKNDVKTRLAIVGFPLDENSSFMKGPASAPPLIREAFRSDSSNLWTENGIDLGEESVFFDAGDIELDQDKDSLDEIEKTVDLLLDKNFLPISLGGDHSITFPIVKAFNKKFPIMHILHFDAHPDLYVKFQSSSVSHACPFSRILENRLVDRLVQVGVRTFNLEQREQADKFSVETIEMKDWKDDIILKFKGPLYISFDMDVLDPAFAPGVSHQEPGGLSTRQVINIIQKLKTSEIVGADIVEFNPRRDQSGITAMAAAKILKEIASRMLQQI